FLNLAENIQEGIFIVSAGGQTQYVNRRAAGMLLFSVEELLEMTLNGLLDAEASAWFQRHLQDELIDPSVPVTKETVFNRKDGTGLEVEITLTKTDWQGELCNLVLFREKSMPANFKREDGHSKENYQILLENSLVGLFKTKVTGEISYVNEVIVHMLEFDSIEELILPGACLRYKYPTQREQMIQELKNTGQVIGFEMSLLTKKGNEKIVLCNLLINGGVIYGSLIDITERSKAVVALRESLELNRLLFLHSADAMLYTKPDGTICAANPEACRLFNMSESEILNLPRSAFADPSDPRLPAAVKERNRTGYFKGELNMIKNGGTVFPAELSSSVFRDFNGEERINLTIRDVSERKRIEKEIIENRQFLKTILSEVQAVVFALDQNGLFTFSDGKALFKLGLKPGEVVGLPAVDVYKDFPDIVDAIKESLSGRLVRRQGSTDTGQSFDTTFQPIFDEEGKVTGVVGVAIDITEAKKAEDALNESKRELSTLMNNLPGMVYACMFSQSCNLKFVSEGATALTGYTSEELVEHQTVLWDEIIHADDRTSVGDAIRNSIENHTSFDLEYRITTKSGSIKYVHDIGQGIFASDGTFLHLEGFITDISERNLAQESLKQSELLLKSSLESQKDSILFSIDLEYRYLYFNKAHSDAMKHAYRKEIAPGMIILDCITSEDDRIEAKANCDRAMKGETHSNIRIFGDFEHDYYESFFNPMVNDKNEIVGVCGLARNINDRIKWEQELKMKNEELHHLNVTKDKFFSILAHDLRGPFNGFLGLTQIIAEELPSLTMSELQNIATKMRTSATNLYRLLENLLEWSRIQQGLILVNPELLLLRPLMLETVELAKDAAIEKEIELISIVPEDLTGFIDKKIFQTILRNLVSNAVKFTSSHGKVEVLAKRSENESVEISVRDNGIGMNQKLLDNLFIVGSQLNRKGTIGEPSTGLGLILSRDFIEKQGGRIWVESKEGLGSTFYFTIRSNSR
ncbi:MAG: PAS domain S-box protein, partial [Prolixibacteraceae bacterium]